MGTPGSLKNFLAPIIGVSAIAAFSIFVVYLLRHVADDEMQWTRMVYIFGGVEAVAFAAFGYFFGKEVNRERADSAERRAADAAADSAKARSELAGAQQSLFSLGQLIEVKTQTAKRPGTDSSWDELRGFARQLMVR